MSELPPGTRRATEAELEWLATMVIPGGSLRSDRTFDTWLMLPMRSIPLMNREAWLIREAVLAGLWDGLELSERDRRLLGSLEAPGRPDAVDEVVPPGAPSGVAGPGQLEH